MHKKSASISGIIAPTLVIAEFIGQIYIDTLNQKSYIARSLEVGDWVELVIAGLVPKVKIGYFTCPLITGNYSITVLGFKPKVIEFVGHKNDGMQTWFMQSNGFADEFLNQNVSSFCGNYSNTFRGDAKQDRCIYLFNASGAIQVMATLVSMDEDGFTLNFTNVNSIFGIRYSAIG